MSVGISFEEMLAWSDEASRQWKIHFDTNPAALELLCDIGPAKNVQGFLRHIWAAELRWAQRLAGLPVLGRDDAPAGPLDALFQLHRDATEIYRNLLASPAHEWDETYTLDFDWIPADLRKPTRRKVAAHALFHSQRHWAQLATLLRQAGSPSTVRGDLIFSPVLK